MRATTTTTMPDEVDAHALAESFPSAAERSQIAVHCVQLGVQHAVACPPVRPVCGAAQTQEGEGAQGGRGADRVLPGATRLLAAPRSPDGTARASSSRTGKSRTSSGWAATLGCGRAETKTHLFARNPHPGLLRRPRPAHRRARARRGRRGCGPPVHLRRKRAHEARPTAGEPALTAAAAPRDVAAAAHGGHGCRGASPRW